MPSRRAATGALKNHGSGAGDRGTIPPARRTYPCIRQTEEGGRRGVAAGGMEHALVDPPGVSELDARRERRAMR